MKVFPIGFVEKNDNFIRIRLDSKFQDALLGLTDFSHVVVIYWFHENDTKKDRNILRVHPYADIKNQIKGVFATRCPKRPNPLAISVCKLLNLENNLINIENIDAKHGSPIIDIKGYKPEKINKAKITIPNWIK